MATWIHCIYRIIVAICKHIATEDALAGGDVDVGIDESTDLRIVISALQVIEARFLGVELAILTLFPTPGFHITKTRGFA